MRTGFIGLFLFISGLGVGLGVGAALVKVRPLSVVKTVPKTDENQSESLALDQHALVKNPLAVQQREALPARSSTNESVDLQMSSELGARVAELEARMAQLESADEPVATPNPRSPNGLDTGSLSLAGFDEVEVSEIKALYNQQQLLRLELRDQAIREGWVDTAEFRKEMRLLRGQAAVRSTLGDDRFDQFLLSQGMDNRIKVEQVMTGSSADVAGVMAGDVISRYADSKIYNFRNLQEATTAGERDELVSLTVIRGSDELQLVVARGPLGVSLTGVQVFGDEDN